MPPLSRAIRRVRVTPHHGGQGPRRLWLPCGWLRLQARSAAVEAPQAGHPTCLLANARGTFSAVVRLGFFLQVRDGVEWPVFSTANLLGSCVFYKGLILNSLDFLEAKL